MAFNPPLGTTTPEIFLDNVRALTSWLTVRQVLNDRAAVNRWIRGAR